MADTPKKPNAYIDAIVEGYKTTFNEGRGQLDAVETHMDNMYDALEDVRNKHGSVAKLGATLLMAVAAAGGTMAAVGVNTADKISHLGNGNIPGGRDDNERGGR